MALIYCPECGHEISNSAVACPNCGRPIQARPVIDRKVVVADVPRDEGFPKWALIPLVVLGGVLLFALFYMMRGDDDSANANLRVNVNTRRPDVDPVRSGSTSSDTTTTTAPPIDSASDLPPLNDSQSITVPGAQTGVTAPPDRGTVVIDAKIATRTGSPQAVKNEKFYLLDRDLESILNEANLEPIEGQSLTNSLGLAVLYPNRYGDFQRDALRAIRSHIKYTGTTDSTGKAKLGDISPDSYYLFGVTKTGSGFAVWSSPVSINAGENLLNLSPQRLTEIEMPSGE